MDMSNIKIKIDDLGEEGIKKLEKTGDVIYGLPPTIWLTSLIVHSPNRYRF